MPEKPPIEIWVDVVLLGVQLVIGLCLAFGIFWTLSACVDVLFGLWGWYAVGHIPIGILFSVVVWLPFLGVRRLRGVIRRHGAIYSRD
jgi:hypothetical protein